MPPDLTPAAWMDAVARGDTEFATVGLSEAGTAILGGVVQPALVMLFTLWVFAEVIFWIWFKRQLHLSQELVPPPILSSAERDFIWSKVLRHAKEYGVWRQVQGWFLNESRTACHSPHEIGRGNLHELLSWAFFFKHSEELDFEENTWIEDAIQSVEMAFQLTVKEGRTGVRCVKHTLDPVVAIHRPLVFYLSVFCLDHFHGFLLRMRGFRRHSSRTASGVLVHYWHRPSGDAADCGDGRGDEPLVFFHGVGLGLTTYLPLLLAFDASEQFLFLLPWVSMNPFAAIPSTAEFASAVVVALKERGDRRALLVGHSFGSLPVAWLVRRHPEVVSRCVLLDPVCILLNLPDVCVNFLYKRPRSWLGHMYRFLGSRELGIARTLHRHFFWTESVLFPEMLPAGSTIVLGERDHVLPARDIYASAQAVAAGHVHTLMLDNLDHGFFLFHPRALQRVLGCINATGVKA